MPLRPAIDPRWAQKTFVDVRDFGISTTTVGSGDDTTGVQAALDALANGPGTVYLPRRALTGGLGIYWQSAPLIIKAGQNLVADGINIVTLKARSDFSGVAMILPNTWTAGGDPNSYWHWGSVENLRIDCAGVAPIGVAVHAMGECAVLRRLLILNAADSGIVLTGAHAPATIEHVSVSNSANYGVKLTAHPTYSGNSGAVRMTGISGDNNLGAHLYTDGAHGISVEGWKSESHSVGFAIAGSSSPTIFATGYFNTSQTTPDLFKVSGTAAPRIASTVRTNGVTNLVNDTVTGRTIPTTIGTVLPFLTYGGKTVLAGPVLRGRLTQTRTGSGSVTIDASAGDVHEITLAGNATSTSITNATVGQELTLTFIQDGTGSRAYTWPAALYDGGAAPANLSTPNRRDTITYAYDGTNWCETGRSQASGAVSVITPARSGRYLTAPAGVSQTSNGTLTIGSLRYMPVYFDRASTVIELGVYIPTGVASALVRLGLYADSDGQPSGSPLVDAGTVDASTSGYKPITSLSVGMGLGRAWVGGVVQAAAANVVGVLGVAAGIAATTGYSGNDMTACVDAASTTGALPSANPTSYGRGFLVNVKVA